MISAGTAQMMSIAAMLKKTANVEAKLAIALPKK